MTLKHETITIRCYREADRERCRGLWRELVEWHREIYADPTIGGERPEDFFERHLVKIGADHIWVAINSGNVVGFAALLVNDAEATLDPIVVSKGFRYKGVGTQLVLKVIDEARALGVKYLNVEPVVRNIEAIDFYRELGFINVGHVQLFMDFTGKKWSRCLKLHKRKFNY